MRNYIINVEAFLQEKGVSVVRNEGKELVVRCLFSGCDNDSKGKEAHLYINKETGQYNCKKCDASGGSKKLREHFGDSAVPVQEKTKRNFTQSLVDECASNIPVRIRGYLNGRGVSDDVIAKKKIGFGNFYGSNWITLPISIGDDLEYSFFILRKDPENTNKDLPKNLFFPKGKSEVTLYGDYATEGEDLVVTEGIMDCLSLLSQGVKTVFSTGGCMTFKEEWLDRNLLKARSIYVAYDNDDAGRKGSEKVLKLLKEFGHKSIYKVTLPDTVGDKGDVNDYLAKFKLPTKDLFTKYASPYPEQIDARQFTEVSLDEVEEVLNLTIKGDKENKLITFLCQLSAFSEDNQFNVMFNAPSSAGKSYIAIEVSKLFPEDALMKLGNCSATSFFHESGKYDKETNTVTVDLSKKILIFTENQHYQLLQKLRSFLSHDEKVMNIKITDKNQKGGHRTKNIRLIGYASVVFCTASLNSDEQEKTRFIILSPEITDEKIRAGIENVISRESNKGDYAKVLDSDIKRLSLKRRIEAIRNIEIKNINMSKEDSKHLRDVFFKNSKTLQPRQQRDVKRLIDLAKALALLNVWFRDLKDGTISVTRNDINNAIALYAPISPTQDLGISPYIHNIYKEVIRPAYNKKNKNVLGGLYEGISYQEIISEYRAVKDQKLDYNYLRQQILPELEACGLIEKEYSGVKVLVHITDRESDGQNISSEMMGVVNI